MHNKIMGSYDEIPEGMKLYLNNYGYHFNKKLWKEATSRMYKEEDGKEESIKPYTKEQVDTLLQSYGIKLKRNKLWDAAYVASMCKSDYLGKSIPDEMHLAMYVKDTIDDFDADEGFVFNRWYADQMYMDNPIEWEDCI